ncbi:hypothetical protein C8J23_101194 [Shewanella chilikensis]|uniref:DUF4328 domain-containing protein n=1 Tax=Shewanella chilikensis TaxID=558541 RepID=A0ABX5PTM5_9GAMM|nr:hypothetical protein C8J23_101194 [Shewanella chilikensis]GGZ31750.1 hypothetical protein GCM10007105_19160 [Shewanella chilikensis]
MKESWISVWWVALINGIWIIADLIAQRFNSSLIFNLKASDLVAIAAAFLCFFYALYVLRMILTHGKNQDACKHQNKD